MTPTDVNSGVYRYIFNHYEYFDLSKVTFGFLTRASDTLRKSSEFTRYGFNIHPFSATQRDDPDLLKAEIHHILSQYDVIHLHTSSWRGFMIEELAMDLGMEKVIVHSHSTGIDVNDDNDRIAQIDEHIKYREQFCEKYATDFCACSKLAADWLFGDKISKDKIKFLPNAIDTTRFLFSISARNNVREALDLKNNFILGHIGRYSYTKNQLFLIKVIAYLREFVPNIFLLCIGEGPCKKELECEIKKLNLEENVLLLDWVDNVQDYLCAMDVFCLPSHFEGFPISVVEAQASGITCVVSSNVTDEIELTDLVCRLPLNIEIWASEIIRIYEKCDVTNREKYNEEMFNLGYDVRQSAAQLQALWIE